MIANLVTNKPTVGSFLRTNGIEPLDNSFTLSSVDCRPAHTKDFAIG